MRLESRSQAFSHISAAGARDGRCLGLTNRLLVKGNCWRLQRLLLAS